MYPDLIASVVVYLNATMGALLGATTTNPLKVFADYAPELPEPYAVVSDISETYAYQSDDSFVADGIMQVAFLAASKAEARSLARQCIRFMSDPNAAIPVFSDGICLEMRPGAAQSVPMFQPGPGVPATFQRIITWHYRCQYYS